MRTISDIIQPQTQVNIVEGGNLPHMEPEGLECLRTAISSCVSFLEYGCGGSTLLAVAGHRVQSVISVETDSMWVEKVKTEIAARSMEKAVDTLYVDVGKVGPWGTPLNLNHADRFWRYIVEPWRVAVNRQTFPDLVLIDGRFRVASFLFSLLSARVGTVILFDDYFDRPHYTIVEEFCPIVERRGRMAVFSSGRRYSEQSIAGALVQHAVDWR